MPEAAGHGLLARRLAELRLALMLFTRLPLGCGGAVVPTLGAALWAFPLAGGVAALLPAAVFALAHAVLPAGMAALLALATGIAVTGALHEDGLADTADGFGGGRTRARKLEIMRDSRIGTYGVLALAVALMLRAMGLAAAPDVAAGTLALVAVGVASRASLPLAMRLLPPAREDGIAAGTGAAPASGVAVAALLGVAALILLPGTLLLLGGLGLAVLALLLLARRQIGGITGDTLGALQQTGEVTLWILLAALW